MTQCFDKLGNVKKFTKICINDNEITSFLTHEKWTKYSENMKSGKRYSELLMISHFLIISPHKANIKHVFSQ
jgi:hypothetical protein